MRYTVIFLLITLAAAILAFGGVLTQTAYIAKGLFVLFIVLFLFAFIQESSNPQQKQR